MSVQESYHTLRNGISGLDRPILEAVPQLSIETVSRVAPLKKGDLPPDFQNSTLTGFKNVISNQSAVPSCFCEKQGVCQKHAKFEPTIDSMIGLLEDQIGELAKDEKSLEENLDFIGKSMDAIIFSRRDTFKE